MNRLESQKISCPYCGELIEILIDCSVEHQEYIEDCQVCCRPIEFKLLVNESGEIQLGVTREDE